MSRYVVVEDDPAYERFRSRKGAQSTYGCPACLQRWYSRIGLIRHMRILHHRCRFCTKAYIRIADHEKRSHTLLFAVEAGACASSEGQER